MWLQLWQSAAGSLEEREEGNPTGDLQVAADGSGTNCLCRALVSSVLAPLCDVEELLTEHGLKADHTTIWRWVPRALSS